jgi:hypothetical protein
MPPEPRGLRGQHARGKAQGPGWRAWSKGLKFGIDEGLGNLLEAAWRSCFGPLKPKTRRDMSATHSKKCSA